MPVSWFTFKALRPLYYIYLDFLPFFLKHSNILCQEQNVVVKVLLEELSTIADATANCIVTEQCQLTSTIGQWPLILANLYRCEHSAFTTSRLCFRKHYDFYFIASWDLHFFNFRDYFMNQVELEVRWKFLNFSRNRQQVLNCSYTVWLQNLYIKKYESKINLLFDTILYALPYRMFRFLAHDLLNDYLCIHNVTSRCCHRSIRALIKSAV